MFVGITLSRKVSTPLCAVLVCLSALTAAAAPKKSDNAAKAGKPDCAGTDMLSEFQTKDPELFNSVRQAADATENANAVLWKISKPGVTPSYLLGTIHLTDTRVTKLSDTARSALKNSSILALEVADLSPTAMARSIASAAKLAIYTDGSSLKAKLSPENYAIVERKLKSAGMPVQTARVFRPWVVTMLMATSDCERKRAKSGVKILDMQLAELAKKNNIPVIGLETIEGQLQALAASQPDQQLDMLRAALAYADRSDDLVETLIQLYINRDLGATWPFQLALAKKAGVPPTAFDGMHKHLLVLRNRKMRDAAFPHIEKGGAFVGVGALHLSGPDGLVALFKKAGFQVTPVE